MTWRERLKEVLGKHAFAEIYTPTFVVIASFITVLSTRSSVNTTTAPIWSEPVRNMIISGIGIGIWAIIKATYSTYFAQPAFQRQEE